jgi:two-component system, NtrC family, nitrogen regulation sensor histidine kinase GlnL
MNTEAERQRGIEERIVEHVSTAVLLFAADLRLIYINPAGEMLFAVSARHVMGQRACDLLLCSSEKLETKLRAALERGHAFTEREIVLTLTDGRRITVNCSVDPLHHFDAPDELLVELYQVDRHLRISREEQLISQQKATQALIRGLAHEIKNPLGGLRGAAQLLEQELPDASLREYTRIIIEEADRLQSLLNRMLGPNRLPRHRDVNIHQVLERVRNLVLAESSGLEVRRDYDPSIPPLLGDTDQLIQAILNIARNGARAAGPQGCLILRTRVLRQFTLGNARHRLVLQVDVEDNGPGIPRDMQERIFLPMVSGAEGGTGLGLTIAQNLVNQHRGLIECRSRQGETVFSIYLPLETGYE